MVELTGVGGVNANGLYQASFGSVHDGMVYQDKLKGIDRRDEIKASLSTSSDLFATGTSYSATSGSIPSIVPTVVDETIRDVTKRDTPLASGLIARKTNRGLFADYVKRTALPTAKVKPEGAALDTDRSTYARVAQKMSYFYSTGELTGPLMVGAASAWKDMLQPEIQAHYSAMKEREEDQIINGNPTSGTTDGSTTDENGFNGLIQLITTNKTDKSSAAITLDNIRDGVRTIREAKGHPTIIVADYKTWQDVSNLLESYRRFNDSTKIDFGVDTLMFDGIPLIPDLFMPTTATSRELLILDTGSYSGAPNIEMRVLMEPTFFELANTADTYKFSIKAYYTMIMVHEAWCYRYYNLA